MISPRVQIVPFERRHLELFDLGDPELKAQVAELGRPSLWRSAFAPGGMLAIGGLVIIARGVAEVWLAPSQLARRYPLALTQAAGRFLDQAWRELKLHRLQAGVLAQNRRACRWIELLGFAREGVMRKFGPQGQDFVLYAKVR